MFFFFFQTLQRDNKDCKTNVIKGTSNQPKEASREMYNTQKKITRPHLTWNMEQNPN